MREKIATRIMNNQAEQTTGLSATRADVNNPSRSVLPEETSDIARIKFRSFFERQRAQGVRFEAKELLRQISKPESGFQRAMKRGRLSG
jgi:hypothetical protein